ncbi:MAG TPA: DNA repair protein RecN [Anaeromyxobacteraceae bacterium]|nr:DNA repair protein RecN [Anaeromyxobacteraceae bacterium]
MLTTLRISGFAIVDAVEVRFGPGLNVLTGETGAGKSILVNALHLVLGGRMSADVLRDGAEEAVVEALFELPGDHPVFARLAAAGVAPPAPGEGAELLVRRVAARGGRGRAYVNGALVTASVLADALRGVVDISGQHEHVSLLDEASHLALLDAFAGADGAPAGEGSAPAAREPPLLARYRAAFARLAALSRERDGLVADGAERGRRADYLAFQLKELDALDPRPGEDEALEAERRVLASAEKLRDAARAAEGLSYGEDGSASEQVGLAVRALAEAAALDGRLGGPLQLLRSAAIELEEAGRELGRYGDAVGGDPDRLGVVEDRLEALRALARKHGGSLAAAVARRGEMAAELASLSGGGERLLALGPEIDAAGAEAAALAGMLTRARKRAARAFAEAVQQELAGLAMARCQLEVAFAPPEGGLAAGGALLGPDGAEQARFLLAPNPGEAPRPLARIASGGELSRILLAVKRTLARRDPVQTYVFDEVDSGIGGAVAEAMGRVLAEVSRGRQVVCITHLPQIAAFADRHHRVAKRVAAGRTTSEVTPLEEAAARRQEVARMMAGATVTPAALEHAGALIEAARLPPAQGRRGVVPRAAARVARAAG